MASTTTSISQFGDAGTDQDQGQIKKDIIDVDKATANTTTNEEDEEEVLDFISARLCHSKTKTVGTTTTTTSDSSGAEEKEAEDEDEDGGVDIGPEAFPLFDEEKAEEVRRSPVVYTIAIRDRG